MLKVFSTPADPSQAIVEALRRLQKIRRTTANSSSSTARQSAPTRCWSAKAPAPLSSPLPASKTPSKSDARPAPSSTTSSSTASSHWRPRISASASTSAPPVTAKSSPRPHQMICEPSSRNLGRESPIYRNLSTLFFRESQERRSRRGSAEAPSRPALHLAPNPPRIPRIRTHLHGRHQRLPATRHAELSGKSRSRISSHKHHSRGRRRLAREG